MVFWLSEISRRLFADYLASPLAPWPGEGEGETEGGVIRPGAIDGTIHYLLIRMQVKTLALDMSGLTKDNAFKFQNNIKNDLLKRVELWFVVVDVT